MRIQDHVRPYTTKTGKFQFKPSLELTMEMDADQAGFCLACGEVQECVEPDAKRDVCVCCGAAKVFGAEELILMGLTY